MISFRKTSQAINKWRNCRRSTAATEFAMILPALLLLTIGSMEVGLIMFDYHKVSEATRRGLRTALIEDPIIDLGSLSSTPITCTGSSVSCSGDSADNTASFTAIVASMQAVSSRITGDNVIVTYTNSGLDISGTGETVTPLITVEVTDLEYEFVALYYVPGLPSSLSLPGFNTTRLSHTSLPDP
jgi:Flp pilus assembly protein TadG